MYMILYWVNAEDDYVTCIHNEDGSIRLFDNLKEADDYANNRGYTDDMRVISIEGVQE